MKPLSEDLRARFCRALERGMTARGAARHFEVSAATGVRWAQQWRKKGKIETGKYGGHKRYVLEAERVWLMERIEEKKDLTLHELLAELEEKRGVKVCCDTLWRFLRRCGKTFKKNTVRQRTGPA